MLSAITETGHKIYYKIYGDTSSENSIILAHGNGNSITDWEVLGYIEKLSPYFRIIAMDALGYGASDKPLDPEEYTAERRAKDVVSVLDHAGAEKVHFFGASIGGSLGFVLADEYPDKFLSFVIGSAHPYGSVELNGCNLFDEEFRDLMLKEGMESFVVTIENKYLGRRFHEGVRTNYLKNNPRALVAANTLPWKNRFDSLKTIKVPVLLFAGDGDPVSILQARIAAEIPRAEISILPETDHAQAYWESEKVVPLMINFFRKYFSNPVSY